MSDLSIHQASYSPKSERSESRAAPAETKVGKTLPDSGVSAVNEASLKSASLYTRAQEEQTGTAGQASRAEALEQAVAKLNDYVQNTERKLNFQLDEEAGLTIIRVYDKQSEELIRQIPSEEAVSLAQKLNQEEPLMLFSAQV
ncbi:flagellar protein FlaG [Saccharospirillum salsuginis]|uniref:Flagellar protein FlaG n=1 Tax=Saccharospirillum salsuginis TaxID=418750 RepID=A0A918K6V6_9GAMM|nr:flagellar protein FlaG [Saccharospirillum salsuginis]GGX50609.1 hypothetical protein GCM10007392_17220 [Saccharospirillum salsuginis]